MPVMDGEEVGEMFVKMLADIGPFQVAMNQVETRSNNVVAKLTTVEKASGRTFSNMSMYAMKMGGALKFALVGMMALTSAVVAGGAAIMGVMTKMASDAGETGSMFDIAFGAQAEKAGARLDAFGKAVGRSKNELRAMAGGLQSILTPMGFSEEVASKFSVQLTKLAVDLGSFWNTTDKEAADSLSSALVGNHETMRKYGVVITEATIKNELLRMGFKGTYEQATEMMKVQARLNLIMKGTEKAQTDATRTAGSFANQMKAFRATLADVGTSLGAILLPGMQVLLNLGQEIAAWVQSNEGSFNSWGESFERAMKRAVEWFHALIDVVKNYDLIWKALVMTFEQSLGPVMDAFKSFATSTFYVFEWLVTNMGTMWTNLTTNMAAMFLGMVNDVKTNIQGMWDFIASGGTKYAFSNMGTMDAFKDLTKGTTKFEMPKVEKTDWDAEWRKLEDEFNARTGRMEDKKKEAVKAEEKEADEQMKLAQPKVKKKIEVDIVANEGAWRKTLVEAFKKNEKDKTAEAQLVEQQKLNITTVQNHKELVAAVKSNPGFAFT